MIITSIIKKLQKESLQETVSRCFLLSRKFTVYGAFDLFLLVSCIVLHVVCYGYEFLKAPIKIIIYFLCHPKHFETKLISNVQIFKHYSKVPSEDSNMMHETSKVKDRTHRNKRIYGLIVTKTTLDICRRITTK